MPTDFHVLSLHDWIGSFVVLSLFWKWVLSWGGATWLEGWRGFFFEGFSPFWSAEQIRFYALLAWIGCSIWFVVGLLHPAYRFWW